MNVSGWASGRSRTRFCNCRSIYTLTGTPTTTREDGGLGSRLRRLEEGEEVYAREDAATCDATNGAQFFSPLFISDTLFIWGHFSTCMHVGTKS